MTGAFTGEHFGTLAGESIGFSMVNFVASRLILFESKRRVNSSFRSCNAGISSALISGGEILGCGVVDGIVRDFDRLMFGSTEIGGNGVYDALKVSFRLSQSVSKVSSRRSRVGSNGAATV